MIRRDEKAEARKRDLHEQQGFRCARCGRLCGMSPGDPIYLDGSEVVCHSCARPRPAALLHRAPPASDG